MVNKTKIIGLLLLLYSFLGYSQVCEQAKKLFENDLYSSKELREYASKAEDSDKVFDAWQILHNENLTTKTNATILKEVENNYQAITNAGGYLKWKNVKGAGKLLDDMVLAMKADFPIAWKFNKVGDDAFKVLDGAGKKWGAVYQDKIVCLARTQIGTAGNPIINRLELIQKKHEV